jgi:ribonuclease HII
VPSKPASPPGDRFHFERQLRRAGARSVAGVDEAGRGPLAGPVVAAAVILPGAWIERGLPAELAGLNDSKQLSAAQRDRFFARLTVEAALSFAIASVEPADIDRLNILRATHQAMARALQGLLPQPDHILVDGLPVPMLAGPQTALVQGDARSYSIAAASVLAKVSRDRRMLEYDRAYPAYGFARHKGYPTPEHLEQLRRHGPCPIHRRSFLPVRHCQGELL